MVKNFSSFNKAITHALEGNTFLKNSQSRKDKEEVGTLIKWGDDIGLVFEIKIHGIISGVEMNP